MNTLIITKECDLCHNTGSFENFQVSYDTFGNQIDGGKYEIIPCPRCSVKINPRASEDLMEALKKVEMSIKKKYCS